MKIIKLINQITKTHNNFLNKINTQKKTKLEKTYGKVKGKEGQIRQPIKQAFDTFETRVLSATLNLVFKNSFWKKTAKKKGRKEE